MSEYQILERYLDACFKLGQDELADGDILVEVVEAVAGIDAEPVAGEACGDAPVPAVVVEEVEAAQRLFARCGDVAVVLAFEYIGIITPVAIDADVPMPSLVEDAARRIASIATGKVSSSTTTSIGMLSMTGSISWSYPAGISSTAAASDPSVSVHQWNV